MIEIVFSDSACGGLKMAQHYGEGKYQGGCIGVIVSHADGSRPTKEEVAVAQREAEEKARLAWESAIPLGGNPADIYGFGAVRWRYFGESARYQAETDIGTLIQRLSE